MQGGFSPLEGAIAGARSKKADYLLCYTRDYPLAVVEAKRKHKSPQDGLQQAKDYAELLGLKFAYSTNGTGIVEFDFTTGLMTSMSSFPSPDDLWARYKQAEGLSDEVADKLLTPFDLTGGKVPRYYQRIAINRAVQAILHGQQRLLLTMATGTGKTTVAFQICQKLWTMGWNTMGEYRKPRILFLADQNLLVDDPMLKDFATFDENIVHKIQGEVVKSREIYFAIYQTTISTRSALPQALAYMMATPDLEKPQFGMLTNGDDVLFIKLVLQPERQYSLSRVFSLYTLSQEWQAALQVLKKLASLIAE